MASFGATAMADNWLSGQTLQGAVGIGQPDLAVEVKNAVGRLRDQLLLRRNLPIECCDQVVQGIHLRLHVLDLAVDVLKLALIADLRADALVVGKAGLVDGRRIAFVAVDRRRCLGD